MVSLAARAEAELENLMMTVVIDGLVYVGPNHLGCAEWNPLCYLRLETLNQQER